MEVLQGIIFFMDDVTHRGLALSFVAFVCSILAGWMLLLRRPQRHLPPAPKLIVLSPPPEDRATLVDRFIRY
jgi:hypothetical protein